MFSDIGLNDVSKNPPVSMGAILWITFSSKVAPCSIRRGDGGSGPRMGCGV